MATILLYMSYVLFLPILVLIGGALLGLSFIVNIRPKKFALYYLVLTALAFVLLVFINKPTAIHYVLGGAFYILSFVYLYTQSQKYMQEMRTASTASYSMETAAMDEPDSEDISL